MILPILRWPDVRLSSPCEPALPGPALTALAEDMLETMYAAPGRGLAAPQVGQLIRLFVMDVSWKEGTPAPLVMANPEILWRSEAVVTGPEGCLSIPGPTVQVTRAAEIRLRWQGLDGAVQEALLQGFAAICAQHEYDHLDGILTLDRLAPEDRARAEAEVLA
ncbi:peptide deformylase [Xinfangfangia pollutisoli]|uniref:peptide deformylase n=1 Tax=Xinfangfangia pollutisoli TaxID=2865960 RepID=UPI001CD2EEAE|nr:peptide deformylase [Xinfangfangia pollutisoli]